MSDSVNPKKKTTRKAADKPEKKAAAKTVKKVTKKTTTKAAGEAKKPAAKRPSKRVEPTQAELTAKFVVEAARHMVDLHCTDVVILDVRGMSDLTNYIIIGSGTSDRQIRSVSNDVAKLAREYKLEKFGTDADQASNWVVTDLVEVMVHLFEVNTRAHYDLEMMWGDAPRIEYKR